ncbi:hypothetical protein HPB47_021730 [Ixodes persulcatus]|uniref:Uncharacterized protein n=1 Tax=Ixodes persulcatus TaxID=34615 RepID=A0AC60QDI7_IXOPE|nr:hypothetical protein HPB47_021730 [Ixodes persulcatus]
MASDLPTVRPLVPARVDSKRELVDSVRVLVPLLAEAPRTTCSLTTTSLGTPPTPASLLVMLRTSVLGRSRDLLDLPVEPALDRLATDRAVSERSPLVASEWVVLAIKEEVVMEATLVPGESATEAASVVSVWVTVLVSVTELALAVLVWATDTEPSMVKWLGPAWLDSRRELLGTTRDLVLLLAEAPRRTCSPTTTSPGTTPTLVFLPAIPMYSVLGSNRVLLDSAVEPWVDRLAMDRAVLEVSPPVAAGVGGLGYVPH